MSALREALKEYLALRRGMGFKMLDAGRLLPRFVQFLDDIGEQHITVRRSMQWVQEGNVQPAEWARRLCFVRGFARFRSATDPRTEIAPPQLLPYRSRRAYSARSRTPFRCDGGQHSAVMADSVPR